MAKAPILTMLILICCGLHAAAQDIRQNRRLSYEISTLGNFDNRTLSASQGEEWLKSERNRDEKGRIGLGAAVLLHYELTAQFSIVSGLCFVDMGFKTVAQPITWTDGSPPTSAFTSFHYQYVQLPIDVKYKFLQRNRLSLFAAVGVSPAVFIGKRSVIHYTGGSNSDPQAVGYNRFNFIADGQLGADYRLSRRFSLSAKVQYMQWLNATNSNLPVREYLNAVGFGAGIRYTPIKKRKHK